MTYYILDLEYNQHYNFGGIRPKPEPACPFEIIQMGMVVMDDKLNIKLKQETLVKPQIFMRMHPHVAKLTGLKMEQLMEAPAFPEAFQEFFGFALGKRSVFCTWGENDIKELYRNILYYDVFHKRLTRKFLNVQRLFADTAAGSELATVPMFTEDGLPATPMTRQIGLKTAIKAIGLPPERPFHSALNDAEYTADVFKYVLNEGDAAVKNLTRDLNLEDLKSSIESRVHGVNAPLLYSLGERLLERKLSERDKEALIEIYKLGRLKKYDMRTETNKYAGKNRKH